MRRGDREREGLSIVDLARAYGETASRRRAPLRRVVERVGRHAVRLACGHVEVLAVGERDAIGRKLPCERCGVAREAAESGEKARNRAQDERSASAPGSATESRGESDEGDPDAA
jgi:hypothetical protein